MLNETIMVSDKQQHEWKLLMSQLKPGVENIYFMRKVMAAQPIWKFFHAMICFRTYGNKYCSALVSFTAMLALNPSSALWKAPGDFNSCLSGIVWVVQLIILRSAVENAGKMVMDLDLQAALSASPSYIVWQFCAAKPAFADKI